MKLAEALAAAKDALENYEPDSMTREIALADLIDAVEETLVTQKREADILLDLADLRRWGGCE